LVQAEAGAADEILRVWEWPSFAVILGAGGQLAEEADEPACRRNGVPILRRSSGGGTVLLGPGCLLFSLVLNQERDPALATIRTSYTNILSRMSRSLADLLPGIRCRGTSDLAAQDRKFSGNSQQRKRRFLLHHGTLLYDFDLMSVSRYLRPPPREPPYRAGRPHEQFLCNLPATADVLKDRLSREWGANAPPPSVPLAEVERLVTEKYCCDEWTRRR
jgi:lipoate-protein ligase A